MRVVLRRVATGVAAAVAAAALLAACAANETGHGALSAAIEATVPTALPAAPGSPVSAPPLQNSPVVSAKSPEHVTPAVENRCAGNTIPQYVAVSIHEQHMWLCHLGTLVLDTPVTTGASSVAADDATPTGTFHIQGRDTNTTLTLNTGRQYAVKYWIPFSAPLYGFHDSSWQTFPYGGPQYTTQGSHGCVHMPLQAIRFFYGWVQLGATVHISA